MRNFLYILPVLFTVATTSAYAQEEKMMMTRQMCDPVELMMQSIVKYNEQPLFSTTTLTQHVSGEWFEGKTMFFVNQDTGTYSMMTLYADGTACMQAVGTHFEPYTD